MTPFFLLPVPVQNMTCFWALLVCLGGITNTIFLWRQKRRVPCAVAALCAATAYFTLHLCREGTTYRMTGDTLAFAQELLCQPCFIFQLLLAGLTLVCVLLYRNTRAWRRTHITSASIKESMDSLPAGVCYYLEGGRCILVNHRMNEICRSLLGRSLQNGTLFYDAVKEKKVCALSDGTAVTFRHRILDDYGTPLHELIADDITELYEKSEKLRRDNERAHRLAAGMKAYGDSIADTVRRQEILQAKINIHDEMNRMILATRKSVESECGEENRADILKMWRGQVLLLCKEAETKRSTNIVNDLNALASAIGVRLVWDGTPKTESTRSLQLFLSATREAMTNAVKHAGARRLNICARESDADLCVTFTNDGAAPSRPVVEAGGLKSLRQRLEDAGGQLAIRADDGFALTITIPKEETTHAVSGPNRGGSGDAPPAL